MKRKLLAIVLIVMSLCIFASCDQGNTNLPGIGGSTGNSGQNNGSFDPNKVTLMSAYSQAQELGFEGTLNEFIEMISGKDGTDGKDGVGISNVLLDSKGNLIVVLSNGTTVDCGKVVGSDGKDGAPGKDGITPTIEISADGYWVINGEKTDVKASAEVGDSTAIDENPQGLEFYLKDDGTYAVGAGLARYLSKIVIPSTYKGRTVTEIAPVFIGIEQFAMSERVSPLQEVVIPDSVITIGSYAFVNCAELESVVIPDSVTSIGNNAFYNCSSLTSVVIPDSVTSIGNYAFGWCSSLSSITFGENSKLQSIGSYAFAYCRELKSIKIPDGVTHIGNEAFKETGISVGGDNGDNGNNSDYTWSQTEVLFEMNEHSGGGELTSGVRRYYAGADVYAVDDIDDAIRQRNKNAASNTNVKPKYTYLADGNKEYSWGANVGRIQQLTNVGGSNCPDVFVNFAYDLTCAQIRGCFANLIDKSWELGNHFYFANNEIPETENYFDSKAGEGYFYEYMRSLSLTPDTKLYCLASNYTLDAVRAMVVIPVNVDLMNSINTTEVLNGLAGDRDGDGDHDIVDFYVLVWNNEWTYNALAAYCNIVFRGNNEESADTDFADDVVGFILGTNSGIYGAAMLYTTSVKIINYNETTQKYEYPETNADLTAFAEALSNLMTENAAKGICTVDRGIVNKYDSAASSELIGIRHKFANNGVLFGGTIMVGSLEDADYQAMRDGSGFGVVPVPLYKTYEEGVNEYNTLVHNMARIVAVSACSTEKSQASAYLDYQSRNSADILEEYYTVQLAAKVGGVAGENNVKMLTYIRNHVRTCFDKTFEDVIADYMLETDSGAYGKRWHYMLQMNKFSMPGISTQYYAYYLEKQKNLDTIYAQWNSLR